MVGYINFKVEVWGQGIFINFNEKSRLVYKTDLFTITQNIIYVWISWESALVMGNLGGEPPNMPA